MPSREIRPEAAHAILVANDAIADPNGPNAVRRLELDRSGQLWELTLGMHTCRGDGRANPSEYSIPAVGYTVLTEVETWHPVHDGPGHTVAEVLVQLSEQLRGETASVQFLGLVETGLSPTRPTPENGHLTGWAVYGTRLYRRSTPLTSDVERRLALPDSAFEDAIAHLIIHAVLHDGQWLLSAQVLHASGGGPDEIFGMIATEKATRPAASDDAIEAARRWITDVLPAGTTVRFFRSQTPERDGSPRE